MRFSTKLFGLGLALSGLAWTQAREPGRSASTGSAPEPTLMATSSPQPVPRGWRTVAVAAGICLVLSAAMELWQAKQLRSETQRTSVAMTGGDPQRAADLVVRYGCAGCHTIPGVPGADGQVGPSLAGLRGRVYVGGVLQNTPANLIGWIVDPQRFSPRSAMPATGITEAEARDVAAYLYGQ